MMKFQFDKDLEYQLQAIASIVDLFNGQTLKQTNFTVAPYSEQIGLFDSGNGIGNDLTIDKNKILENLREVQLRNGLPLSESLDDKKYNFDIDMETGTGKTYVYLRTIMELHKNYGFSKFIIVVPNIAIKEGVFKSLQITENHFNDLYENTPYNYFVYNSDQLEQVRNFAVSNNLEIMVINIQAFRKSFKDPAEESKANIIHRPNDKLNGMKPIELIAETNPFVIIDEPQSVDTTDKAKEAIKSLNPLSVFRYSATHVEKHNLVYKLDAIDSYNLGLVKQIEVAGFEAGGDFNKAYIKLISVKTAKNRITAKIEMDVKNNKGIVNRKKVTIRRGDDLYEKSNRRDVYEGYIVNDIYCELGNEFINFTSKPDVLRIGKPVGYVKDIIIKEQQIRKTIEEHLNKELLLNKVGIKVLSLFFIDRVAKYRYYDEDGNRQKGIYAQLFETHYSDLIKNPKYATLINNHNMETIAENVHDGYFSVDNSGRYKDTLGASIADNDTYSIIMRNKERLLSFEERRRFIFSHSTLREGWDNPNVFQICTLNDSVSEIKKRQEIGRGLRLAVNQKGERQHGFRINTLTVMANESYEEFAAALQKEYEDDTGIKFNAINKHSFANILIENNDGTFTDLGQQTSEIIYNQFLDSGYIDSSGNIKDELKIALMNDNINIQEEFQNIKKEIINIILKASSPIKIRNNSTRQKVNLNKRVYLDEAFKELWDKVKHKTTYSVTIDSDNLIEACCEKMRLHLSIHAPSFIYTRSRVSFDAGSISAEEHSRLTVNIEDQPINIPDIISYLQNETNLTRKTIVSILIKSNTLHLFKVNPHMYMEQAAQIITTQMRLMIVNGIKYTKIGDSEYYTQELFKTEELMGYLSKNMIKSEKSVYEYVIYDSINEENFAKSFESNSNIKLYAKLPSWFKIATPLGSYNPDWVILIEINGKRKLYFVLETKVNTMFDSLRPSEYAKIKCARKHFEALDNEVVFEAVDDFNRFIEQKVKT